MRFPLDESETILPNVRILWGKRDKAFLSEASGKPMVKGRVDAWIRNVSGAPFQTMLAHHDGPALTCLDVFRNQQYAVAKDIGPYIEHHFITAELGLVIQKSRAWVSRQAGRRQPAYHVFPHLVAIDLSRFSPAFRRRAICFGPQLCASLRRLSYQLLRVSNPLLELPAQARLRISVTAKIQRSRLDRPMRGSLGRFQ